MARLLQTCKEWRTWEHEVSTNTSEVSTDLLYVYMAMYNNSNTDAVYIRETATNVFTYGTVIPVGSYKELPVENAGKKYVKTETGTASLRVEVGLL